MAAHQRPCLRHKYKPVLLKNAAAAAGVGKFLKDCDFVALCAQADRGGQSAEAGSNDDDFQVCLRRWLLLFP